MNRSFWLGVLMLLDSTVCQSPVPVVSGNNTIRDVLAVTLAEGCWFWAWPVATANETTIVNASMEPIHLLVLCFMVFLCASRTQVVLNSSCRPVLECVRSRQHDQLSPSRLLGGAPAPKAGCLLIS